MIALILAACAASPLPVVAGPVNASAPFAKVAPACSPRCRSEIRRQNQGNWVLNPGPPPFECPDGSKLAFDDPGVIVCMGDHAAAMRQANLDGRAAEQAYIDDHWSPVCNTDFLQMGRTFDDEIALICGQYGQCQDAASDAYDACPFGSIGDQCRADALQAMLDCWGSHVDGALDTTSCGGMTMREILAGAAAAGEMVQAAARAAADAAYTACMSANCPN